VLRFRGEVVLDYDAVGNLVAVDIDEASRKLDLSEVITIQTPVTTLAPEIASA
jgi:uncharacterized protein YuzE